MPNAERPMLVIGATGFLGRRDRSFELAIAGQVL